MKRRKWIRRLAWLLLALAVLSNTFVDNELAALYQGIAHVVSQQNWLERLWQDFLRDENPVAAFQRLHSFVEQWG